MGAFRVIFEGAIKKFLFLYLIENKITGKFFYRTYIEPIINPA